MLSMLVMLQPSMHVITVIFNVCQSLYCIVCLCSVRYVSVHGHIAYTTGPQVYVCVVYGMSWYMDT